MIPMVKLLLTVNEGSYFDQFKPQPGDAQGTPHPIAWYRDGQAVRRANMARPWTSISNTTGWDSSGIFRPPGRMWYTGLGHRSETWRDETFQSHVQGGIDWVLGVNTTKPKTPKTGVVSTSNNRTTPSDMAEEGSAGLNTAPGSRLGQTALYGLVASTLLFHLALVL